MQEDYFLEMYDQVRHLYRFVKAIITVDDVMNEIDTSIQLENNDGTPWTRGEKARAVFLTDLYRWLLLSGHTLGDGSPEELRVLLVACTHVRDCEGDEGWQVPYERLSMFYSQVAPDIRKIFDIPRQMHDASTIGHSEFLLHHILQDRYPGFAQQYIDTFRQTMGQSWQEQHFKELKDYASATGGGHYYCKYRFEPHSDCLVQPEAQYHAPVTINVGKPGNEVKEHMDLNPLQKSLLPIFMNDVNKMMDFLRVVDGAKDIEITEHVNNLVTKGTILRCSRKERLWSVLHEYGIYQASDKNWCNKVN